MELVSGEVLCAHSDIYVAGTDFEIGVVYNNTICSPMHYLPIPHYPVIEANIVNGKKILYDLLRLSKPFKELSVMYKGGLAYTYKFGEVSELDLVMEDIVAFNLTVDADSLPYPVMLMYDVVAAETNSLRYKKFLEDNEGKTFPTE